MPLWIHWKYSHSPLFTVLPMLLSWHIWGLINNSKWAFKMKIKHRGKGYREIAWLVKTHTERVQEVLREDSEDRKTGFSRFPSPHFITSVRSTETQESLLWAPGTNRGLTVSREHQVSRHDPSPSISTISIIHSTPVVLYSHTSSLCHDFYRYHFEPFLYFSKF